MGFPSSQQLLILVISLIASSRSVVVELTRDNFDHILKQNDVVFVNFFADWCRFSQMLKPIFSEASEKFKDAPPGKVTWGSIDADRQPDLATRYHVSKYPTLKMFRNGELVKKEYRGQRSVDSLSAFVEKHLNSTINVFLAGEKFMEKIDMNKRNVIGRFSDAAAIELDNFRKIASILRDDCVFHQGPAFPNVLASIDFIIPNSEMKQGFNLDAKNYDQLKSWLTEKCIPLVREITFENAEELTEEGLPFLILFKHPDDKTSEQVFTEAVLRELPDQKSAVNCLYADGRKFAHPLAHLGKGEKDLPIVAIDSFRHMYLFPNMAELNSPGKLRQFILDLHSGKLHREFHNGPDHPMVAVQVDPNGVPETQPPPSVFDKLKPSHSRYTLLNKDEL